MSDTQQNNLPRPGAKIGLALGSGSARGWAHIGIIQALEEAGIRVNCIAGSSIGAMVGAVHASGRLHALKESALQFDWKKVVRFFDIVFPRSGLVDGNRVSDFLRGHVKEKEIQELQIPFCAVCTGLAAGNEVILRKGDIIEAVRASISIPGIFTPVNKDGMILVDGGLVNPVPVSVARGMGADFVIAVDLNHDIVEKKGFGKCPVSDPEGMSRANETREGSSLKNGLMNAFNRKMTAIDIPVLAHMRQWITEDPMPSIFEVLVASINIMEAQITATQLKNDPPDLLIQPALGHLRILDFHLAETAIAEGYRAARSSIDSMVMGK